MHRLIRRLAYAISQRRRDAELAEELDFHRERKQRELERAGLSSSDAARAAARALGNVTLAREDARGVWIWPAVERVWHDVRHGAGLLWRQPGFAATAILTLAVGVAATTTVFSVVESELWRPLPFPQADRLVAVFTTGPGAAYDGVSAPEFLDWQSQSRAFEQLAAFRGSMGRRVLRGRGAPESVVTLAVTANFFATLRVTPALGLLFGAGDESRDAALLTDGCWRRHFGSDPRVVGTEILLDDRPVVIAGVMPPGARLEFAQDPDLFVRLDVTPGSRAVRDLGVVGRLQDTVSVARADADLRTVALRLAGEHPVENGGRGVRVEGLRDAYRSYNWRPLFFFLGAAVFVLLLSCANVADLLLARALRRQHEFAIRAALGGGRGALVRQLVVEGALIAVPGAAFGLLLAAWALALLPGWLPPEYLARGGRITFDARVYAVTLAVSGLTAMLFGLGPALFASRRDVNAMLAHGGRTVAGSAMERRARHAFVVAEVALALVLSCGAGLFLNSFLRLTNLPLGFDPRDTLTLQIVPAGARYREPGEIARFAARLEEQVRANPGVVSVAVANSVPLGSGPTVRFVRSGRPQPAPGEEPSAIGRVVTPDYFRTLGIRRLSGRDLSSRDTEGAPRVALVNEHLARRIFAGENPVGKELVLTPRGRGGARAGAVQIVGVVANIKDVGLNEVDFNNIYLPFAQNPAAGLMLIVKAGVPTSGLLDAVRREALAVDPSLPVSRISTMTERVDDAAREDRFNLMLIGIFAVLAVLLAAVGIYGAMAYSMEQRTAEFGVRLALGAERSGILALALGQSLRLGAAGTVLGLALSLLLARVLGSALYLVPGQHNGLIYGVGLTDPRTLSAACAALIGVSALAGLVPARRVTRVDPVVALRCD